MGNGCSCVLDLDIEPIGIYEFSTSPDIKFPNILSINDINPDTIIYSQDFKNVTQVLFNLPKQHIQLQVVPIQSKDANVTLYDFGNDQVKKSNRAIVVSHGNQLEVNVSRLLKEKDSFHIVLFLPENCKLLRVQNIGPVQIGKGFRFKNELSVLTNKGPIHVLKITTDNCTLNAKKSSIKAGEIEAKTTKITAAGKVTGIHVNSGKLSLTTSKGVKVKSITAESAKIISGTFTDIVTITGDECSITSKSECKVRNILTKETKLVVEDNLYFDNAIGELVIAALSDVKFKDCNTNDASIVSGSDVVGKLITGEIRIQAESDIYIERLQCTKSKLNAGSDLKLDVSSGPLNGVSGSDIVVSSHTGTADLISGSDLNIVYETMQGGEESSLKAGSDTVVHLPVPFKQNVMVNLTASNLARGLKHWTLENSKAYAHYTGPLYPKDDTTAVAQRLSVDSDMSDENSSNSNRSSSSAKEDDLRVAVEVGGAPWKLKAMSGSSLVIKPRVE